MANLAESAGAVVQAEPVDNVMVFGGQRRNMAMGVAMLGAGLAAFVSGLAHSFFAQAMAWVFVAWGAFFLYGDLLLSTRRIEVRDDSLTVDIPMRFWSRKHVWEWKNISRMDIIVHGRDIDQENAELHVHHQYPGEIHLDREDRNYDALLARLIIEHAKLKPDAASASLALDQLPLGQNRVYTWKK
jgi:hypothetical protein